MNKCLKLWQIPLSGTEFRFGWLRRTQAGGFDSCNHLFLFEKIETKIAKQGNFQLQWSKTCVLGYNNANRDYANNTLQPQVTEAALISQWRNTQWKLGKIL